jgi:hypothetical protein
MPLFAQVLRKKHATSAGPLVNPGVTIAQPGPIYFRVQIQSVTKNLQAAMQRGDNCLLVNLSHYLSLLRNAWGSLSVFPGPKTPIFAA